MKKYKLLFTTLFLALTLAFAPIQSSKAYGADGDGDPQGYSNSAKAPPSSPTTDLVTIVSKAIRWLFGR